MFAGIIAIVTLTRFVCYPVALDYTYPKLSTVVSSLDSFPRLTIEESLGAIFAPMTGGRARYQATTKALPYVRNIIKNVELCDYHDFAILQLGLIGEEEDVVLLDDYVKFVLEKGTSIAEANARDAAMRMLPQMGIRKVPGAQAALRRMCEREYWTFLENRSGAGAVDDYVSIAIRNYSMLQPRDLDEVRQTALDAIKDDQRRLAMAVQITIKNLNEHRREREMKLHRWISPKDRARYRSFFNGDLDKPGPSELAIELR